MGFQMEGGQDAFVSPAALAAIREWIDGPQIVGEFYTTPSPELLPFAQEQQLDAIQLGPFYSKREIAAVAKDFPVLQEFVINATTTASEIVDSLTRSESLIEAYLLNFTKGGIRYEQLSEQTISTAQLREWCANYPILIDIDFGTTPAATAWEYLQPLGLAVQGGAEEKVGFKNFDELDTIFESLEAIAHE